MTDSTKLVGIIGYPIKHSISPVFQQAALDFHYLPARYEAWETPLDQLAVTVSRFREPRYLGANVTVPHKEAVVPMMDEVEGVAARIGAVNTIVNRAGKLVGHNTDVAGFLAALEREAAYQVKGKRAVIVGAGGAARAVLFALIEGGAAEILVANRHPERAEALVAHAQAAGYQHLAAIDSGGDRLAAAVSRADLLVNATPLGTRYSAGEQSLPVSAGLLRRGLLVYDLVYNPLRTPLLVAAERAGCATLNGLAMLVYQGAASFELWTGKPAPIGLMFGKAREALGER